MTKRLDDTVALVTGASSGIGYATAQRLAALGAKVVAVARRKERLDQLIHEIGKSGGVALAVEADVTDKAQVAAAVGQTIERFGRLDTLINNAGLMLIGSSSDAEVEDWERMIEVNTLGMLYTAKAALPHLIASAEREPRKVADIVNVSSVVAHVYNAINGVYALTKAGLNAFSESLRKELGTRHIRVSVLEPGSVATELVSHNRPHIRDVVLRPFFDQIEVLLADDIADAVEFIVTRPRRASVNKMWIGPTEQV
jgi:NADP-dependent 3-hydroxy acid dehydrogenase YdfG